MRYFFIFILVIYASCMFSKKQEKIAGDTSIQEKNKILVVVQDSIRQALRFDFPVGKPNADGYYNAQSFGENSHLGDDWNATTGGNTDLEDPIYSIGVGKVVFAKDLAGGWGNVVRIVHHLDNGKTYESVYAHCDHIIVKLGDWVARGEQIATIGNAGGAYLAHLHLEIRDSVGMDIGAGYSEDQRGYIDPTAFIEANRNSK